MIALEKYIELYNSQLIFESVNIKGFSKWCEKNVEISKSDYDESKTIIEGFDNKVKNVIKKIYNDLGLKEEEENNKNNDEEKRNSSDGPITKTGDEQSTDGAESAEGSDEESDNEKLEEKLNSAETKQKVYIIKMAKTISEKLQKNDNKLVELLFEFDGIDGTDFLDSCIRVALNSGNLNIDWIINSFVGGENLDIIFTMLIFIKELEGNSKYLTELLQYIGIEE